MNPTKHAIVKTKPQIHLVKRKTVGLHQRNPHQGRYSFARLTKVLPSLKSKVIRNPNGEETIRFDDPDSVLLLNQALLISEYQIQHWSIPKGCLCPPLPGRADYVHRLADILYRDVPELKKIPVSALDIGTGANGIYPLIGVVAYDWAFKASDIDQTSLKNVEQVLAANAAIKDKIVLALQTVPQHIFQGIIQPGERYHVTLCNPPFHRSLDEAMQGTKRKINNLRANQRGKNGMIHDRANKGGVPTLNFGGQKAELWCPGGEIGFIRKIATESARFQEQVLWFSTLVSKKENVRPLQKQLEKLNVDTIHIVQMTHGQKTSRFIAWSYHSAEQRKLWVK